MNSDNNSGVSIGPAGIVRETAAAYFLTIAGCSDSAWLPKSQLANVEIQVEDYGDGSKPGRYLTATIPAWLYRKLPWNRGPIPYATRPTY